MASWISSLYSGLVSHTSASSTCCPASNVQQLVPILNFLSKRFQHRAHEPNGVTLRDTHRVRPPEKMLQCRCPPEHLRSSAFALSWSLSSTLWACGPALVRPHRSTTARTDIGRPPPARHQACPGSHVSSTRPSFLHAWGVHADRFSRHRSVSCTIHLTHKRSSVPCPHVPTPSIVLNPSVSSATVRTLRHRGDPTSRSGISFVCHSRALRRSVSLLKSCLARRSMAVPGRKSKRRTRTANRPGPKISATSVSVLAQSSHQHAKLFHLLLFDVHVSRHIHDRRTVNSDRHRDRLGSRCSMSTRRRSNLFDTSPPTSSFNLSIIRFASCLSSTRSQPTEHGRSHHQSSPLQHGRGMPPCVTWQPFSGAPHRIQGIHQCIRVVSARCSFSSKSALPHNRLHQHGQADHLLWQPVLPKSQKVPLTNLGLQGPIPRAHPRACQGAPQSFFLPVVSVSVFELARHQAQCQRGIPNSSQRPRGTIHRSNVPGDDLLSCQEGGRGRTRQRQEAPFGTLSLSVFDAVSIHRLQSARV